jgi:phage terminase large subunit GpA-like protein
MNRSEWAYSEAFSKGLTPDRELTVSEWADEYRMLPSKGSAEPGRYRTARVPFAREIQDSLSPSCPVQRIVFMKSSQVGGTELGLNWLGSIIHLTPAPVMIVQPTIELAERFSKQRVQPMIDETPELSERISPARSRDSGNSILMKDFLGGVLVMSGSNSAVSLRSMPVRFLFCDEISAYEKDVGEEGDPVSLAEKRTQTFSRRKIFLNSTPTVKDYCRIEFEYLRSDQRRYFVPCPLCGGKQWLQFRQLKWENDDPKSVQYECEHCTGRFREHFKTKMLADGEWQATAPSDGQTRGYHISALYSPLGWKSWAEIVREFLESKADAPKLKAFVNSVLGETFEEEYAAKVGAEGLRSRAETYEPFVVPDGGLVLTAGVDVQDNRLAVSLYAYGREEESWLISHQEVFGDPGRPELWAQLDDILLRTYRHASGGEMQVSVACIDSGGHYTQEVYQYVRERKRTNQKTFILAVKGQSQRGKIPIGKPTRVDINFRGATIKSGAELYPVGTDTIKGTIYGRFKHNEAGPGFIHFHADVPDDFWTQITAEKQITRYVKGFPIREWAKKNGARNEALDCIVYAYAAMQFLYTRYNRATMWEQLERKLSGSPQGGDTQALERAGKSGVLQNTPNGAKIGVTGRKRNYMTDF